jgi:hypothetical protein
MGKWVTLRRDPVPPSLRPGPTLLFRLGLWSPRRFAAAGFLLAGGGLGLLGIVAQWMIRTELHIRHHWLPLAICILAIGVMWAGIRLWVGALPSPLRRDPPPPMPRPTGRTAVSRIPTVRRR